VIFSKWKPLDPVAAAAIIDGFAGGRLMLWEWQNFLRMPLDHPQVAQARERCRAVRDEFPPERPGYYCSADGLETLRAIARQLRDSRA
jgi:hypothetical protein